MVIVAAIMNAFGKGHKKLMPRDVRAAPDSNSPAVRGPSQDRPAFYDLKTNCNCDEIFVNNGFGTVL